MGGNCNWACKREPLGNRHPMTLGNQWIGKISPKPKVLDLESDPQLKAKSDYYFWY